MRFLFIILLLAGVEQLHSQQKDSTIYPSESSRINNQANFPAIQETKSLKRSVRTLVVPLALITYGAIAQSSEDLREFDLNVKTEVRKKDPDFHTVFDNYLQYAPGL